MKGVAFAAGSIVLIRIIEDWQLYWPRLFPLLSSFLLILMTHVTWSRGALLTNSRANILDSVLPMLMGVLEFLLFAILLPSVREPDLWRWWFFIVAVHSLIAVFIITNRISLTVISEDFEIELDEMANALVKWMNGAQKGAIAVTFLATMFGLVTLLFLPKYTSELINVVVVWLMVAILTAIFIFYNPDQNYTPRCKTMASGGS